MCRSGDTKINCEQCPKHFFTAKKLKLHVDKVHLKLEEQTCEECGKILSGKNSIKRHKLSAHNDGKKDYQCEDCGRCFVADRSLTEHKKIHGEKNWKCDKCGIALATEYKLSRHMEAVHGTAKYQCPHCGITKKTQNGLRSHMNMVHIRAFKCNECDKEFG